MPEESKPEQRFEGKVALIIGAGKGIGREIAKAFATEGAKVAVNDLTPINLDETVRQIRAARGTVQDYVTDISVRMLAQEMTDRIMEAWQRIDILVNNSGVEPLKALLDLDTWDWQRSLDVNLSGPFYAIQAVGRVMRSQGGGVMVNLASSQKPTSILGDRAALIAGKSGLLGLTRVAAHELSAYNIRVNAITTLESDAIIKEKSKQEARPVRWSENDEDAVELVLFLCSNDAAHINGQIFHIDSGKTST